MNKYYLYSLTINFIFGPYSFKTCMKEWQWRKDIGETCVILKEVVDKDGRNVKEN